MLLCQIVVFLKGESLCSFGNSDLGFHCTDKLERKLCENETLGLTNSFCGSYSCLPKHEYVKEFSKIVL